MIDTSIRKNINIRDKRVSVIGLGLSGAETAKLAITLGQLYLLVMQVWTKGSVLIQWS